jgi:hypothetical protein
MTEENIETIEDKALNPKFERIGYKDQVLDIINSLQLKSETDKHILKSRFLYEVLNYDARRNHTKKYYNGFRFTVTVGSILLPAILSIGQMDPEKLPANFDNISYWSAWSISLMVTICNGFLQLFSLDKNYFELAITSEQLKTEGWQFFQLSGKYDEYPDHEAAYRPFCKSIENIKRKQVEKEFSGKGEVKKKKEFDFAKELEKVIPQKYTNENNSEIPTKEVNTKVIELDTLMKDKMGKLDTLMGMLEKKNIKGDTQETLGNVREMLKDSIKENVTEVASEVVSSTINKV